MGLFSSVATWPLSFLWTGSLAQPQWLISRHTTTTPSWDSRDYVMHCHSSLKTYKTYRPRKAIWSFALVCLSCWWVPFNRLGSLRMDTTFPHHSLMCHWWWLQTCIGIWAPRGCLSQRRSDWIPVRPQEQRSNSLLTRDEISALLLSVQILFFLSLVLIRRK